MKESRSNFLQKASLIAGTFSVNNFFNELHAADFEHKNKVISGKPPDEIAADEDYRATIQQAYSVNLNIINLNNAGVSCAG